MEKINKIILMLASLQAGLLVNANAMDDDKEETWNQLMEDWLNVRKTLDDYFKHADSLEHPAADGKCIYCSKLVRADAPLDYDGWPVHEHCLGPYDVTIHERDGSDTLKKGFLSLEEIDKEVAEYHEDFRGLSVSYIAEGRFYGSRK